MKRCIVTADALHCHPAMASAVLGRGADYALKVKANHAPLFASAVAAFVDAETKRKSRAHVREDKGHDRRE